VRSRALIHLLSSELFGRSLILRDFPRLKAIRALGMTDKQCYAEILEDKFEYTNTYYDREPRMDFTEPHQELWGQYDFIISSDVLEHIAPPVDRAINEVYRLLGPNGFFVATVPCTAENELREHFPELHEYRVVPLGQSAVLINRGRNGQLAICEDLAWHAGPGATLEMRAFGWPALRSKLLETGFREVSPFCDNLPEIGIIFDSDVSQPLVSRKNPFAMSPRARTELLELWRTAEDKLLEQRIRAERLREEASRQQRRADALALQIRMASKSRWLRLGRYLGLGPKFGLGEDA
jgi:SAM-dependent methyltransferase